ncbi:MAG: hypothetical protein LUH82_07270, partial [Clostridiales bacterium]|nr:hypothetical protein [Clostridiales bacterium]
KTEATASSNGVTSYTATVTFMGETYTDTKDVADIAQLSESTGTSSSPDTGSTANVLIFAAIMLFASPALVVTAFSGKKEKYIK